MLKLLTGILFLSAFFIQVQAQDKLVKFDDPRIAYSCRAGFKTDVPELYWPGASVKINLIAFIDQISNGRFGSFLVDH